MNTTTDDIYERLEISGADITTKKTVINNVISTTEVRFAQVAEQILNDDQLVDLNRVAEDGDFDKVKEYIESNIPHAASLYEAILLDSVDEVRDIMKREGLIGKAG